MKEEILNKFMEKLLTYVNSTEVFLKDQIPDYLQQLLTYKMYESIAVLILLTILFLVLLGVFVYMLVKLRSTNDDFFCVMSFITGTISFIILITLTLNAPRNINTIIKIKYAPKVYIIDYLRGGK